MYAHCVYCSAALGSNEAIEAFPVGRTLAFDGAAGRLWVVCPQCARWNLTPLEERWEAIDACERLYRATPLRASTDQIGLARTREGTRLIRIGAPSVQEFATWRYAREFAARRRRTLAVVGTLSVVSLGAVALKWVNPGLASSIPALGLLGHTAGFWSNYRLWIKPVARVPHEGRLIVLRRPEINNVTLQDDDAAPDGWRLNVLHRQGRTVLTGGDAQRLLGRLLRHLNDAGGSASRVDGAVRALVDAGSPEAFLSTFRSRHGGSLSVSGGREPQERLLALEMALHQDTERLAMEGELQELVAAWKEAEEIAAIADNLLVPAWVSRKLKG